jgi:hypothetical protein
VIASRHRRGRERLSLSREDREEERWSDNKRIKSYCGLTSLPSFASCPLYRPPRHALSSPLSLAHRLLDDILLC